MEEAVTIIKKLFFHFQTLTYVLYCCMHLQLLQKKNCAAFKQIIYFWRYIVCDSPSSINQLDSFPWRNNWVFLQAYLLAKCTLVKLQTGISAQFESLQRHMFAGLHNHNYEYYYQCLWSSRKASTQNKIKCSFRETAEQLT